MIFAKGREGRREPFATPGGRTVNRRGRARGPGDSKRLFRPNGSLC